MTEKKHAVIGEYQLVRTNRRTLSITLDRDGRVTAHAPLKMPLWQIERFLMEKSGWIARKQKLLQGRASHMAQYELAEGGRLPWLGGELVIRFTEGKIARAENGVLYLPRTESPKTEALKWLRAQAKQVLPLYVEKWARVMGLRPARTSFGYAEKRWGSMSSKGGLRLNVALMHLGPAQIDYIVVHELTHMRHMNHSPAFHAAVEATLPGAARLRKEIKALGGYLELLREKE